MQRMCERRDEALIFLQPSTRIHHGILVVITKHKLCDIHIYVQRSLILVMSL
jgi:hypothetical protein